MMNLSTGSAARRDSQVRAEMKRQQRARLALKAKVAAGEIEPEVYSEAYAAQPDQLERAAQNAEVSAMRRAARAQANSAGILAAQGGAAAFEKAAEE